MKTRTKSLSFSKKNKSSDKSSPCKYSNNDNDITTIDIDINNSNSNNNNKNDLINYEIYLKQYQSKGFKMVSIIENTILPNIMNTMKNNYNDYGDEKFIGFELKPNELFEINNILLGERSIGLFLGGERFYVNFSSDLCIKASNLEHGAIITRTKSKIFIAIYQLAIMGHMESSTYNDEIFNSIRSTNAEDIITNLV